MNPKSLLSKTTSVIATLLLAVGGSLIATQSASATSTYVITVEDTSNHTITGSPASIASSTDFFVVLNVTCTTGTVSISDVNKVSITPLSTSNLSTGANLLDDNSPATAANANDVGLWSPDSTHLQYRKLLTTATPGGAFLTAENLRLMMMINAKTSTTLCSEAGVGGSITSGAVIVSPPLYTVTLNANLGVAGSVTSVTQTIYGGTVSLPNPSTPSNVPTRSGYTFAGWSTNQNALTGTYSHVPVANVTLYATWTANGGGGGGGGQPTYTMTSAPSYSIANGVATANDGTWSGTGGTINRWWVLCDTAKTATTTMPPVDCYPIYTASTGGTMEKGTTLTTQTTFYRPATNPNDPRVAITFASSYLLLYIAIGNAQYTTATQAGPAPQQNNVTATVERSIPTPVFQAPILNSIAPKMSAGFSSNGGRLVLKDVKPTDITSVTLNGKTVAVVPSKSGAALRIPAGAGAGDLKFTMADGTVIDVPNAVKITVSQVDPKLVDLNNLPNFKAGSVAVPSTIKAALAKNKEVILDSANAKCVGYATSNSAAARATALSRASNVCGIITDMNENIEPLIKVLVNKVVAKKSPVRYQTW